MANFFLLNVPDLSPKPNLMVYEHLQHSTMHFIWTATISFIGYEAMKAAVLIFSAVMKKKMVTKHAT